MAYSALYENNKKGVEKFLKAARMYETSANSSRLERFENIYAERKELW